MAEYLIGIDEGTTGTKVCIFDTEGHLISSAYEEYPSYYPKRGYVEQDVAQITDAFFSVCKAAVERADVDPSSIQAVSLSSQGAAMILVDENGNVVRNRMIGWQDLRNTEVHDDIHAVISDAEHYAIEGSCVGGFNTGVLVWLQKNEPETWKRVKRICTNQDYFLHQLGAEGYPCDIASTHRISMLDVNKNEWSPILRKAYGCENVELPEIVTEPGKIVGRITPEVAEKTGFPVGCRICVGAQDVNCSSYGVGGTTDEVATMVVGTFGGSYLIVDKPIRDPARTILVKGNQGMGNWQLEAFSHTAASAFRWFRDKLCPLEVATSQLMGVDPYSLMTEIAEKSVPGSNGVTALTCLQGSHGRNVNDAMRGSFLGITLGTEKADLAHAVLEGICFEMYDILLMQEAFAKPVRAVRLSGGVTKSPMWCQMFANVMNRRIELCESPEAGALGAAMYAGVGVGIYRDCIEAAEKCVRVKEAYEPDPAEVEQYKIAFDRWNAAFNALNGAFYN